MHVLIVQSCACLGALWQDHFAREDAVVTHVQTQHSATTVLAKTAVDVIILDLMLKDGAAIAVADYALYKQPLAQVIIVTDRSVFSDGSIFAHLANARAFMPTRTRPSDLFAMAQHFVTGGRQAVLPGHGAP